jgi:hypothetical protein
LPAPTPHEHNTAISNFLFAVPHGSQITTLENGRGEEEKLLPHKQGYLLRELT